MAGDAKKLQPIIVKRIRRAEHEPHGGAWKIAYADFVTAMMAFFLLMWLLGSTSEGDKKGLQDYFQSPLKISLLGGGSGAGDASSVIRGGGTDLTRTSGQVRKGDIEAERKTFNLQALKAVQAQAEQQRLLMLSGHMREAITSSPQLSALGSQVRLDMTRDGLRIQIVDEQHRPMFDSGADRVKPYMREILRSIGRVLAEVPNKITLEGHTDALPYSAGNTGYSNWELSSDRANASRRELIAGGLGAERVVRVQGLASSIPYDARQPLDPVNRRISIIVMSKEAEDRFFRSGDGAEDQGADNAAGSASAVQALARRATAPATTPAPTGDPAGSSTAPVGR